MTNDQTVTQAIAAKLGIERKEREARAEQWSFVRSQLGWVPEDQVSVERNELILDDYQSSIGNHSYLEQVHLWEVQPGEGEDLRRALLMLPELLSYQVRDAMTDDERVAVGWTDIPHAEAITAWNTRTAHSGEGRDYAEAFDILVDVQSALVLTADYSDGATVSSFVSSSTQYERLNRFLHERQYADPRPDGEVRSNGAGEDAAKVEADEYLVRKNGYYYRPNAAGYTYSVEEAGRFTLERAIRESHPNGPDGPRDGITYELAPPRTALSDPQGEVERLREALVAIRQRGIERDVKWAGMNAHDIARAALAQPEAGGE